MVGFLSLREKLGDVEVRKKLAEKKIPNAKNIADKLFGYSLERINEKIIVMLNDSSADIIDFRRELSTYLSKDNVAAVINELFSTSNSNGLTVLASLIESGAKVGTCDIGGGVTIKGAHIVIPKKSTLEDQVFFKDIMETIINARMDVKVSLIAENAIVDHMNVKEQVNLTGIEIKQDKHTNDGWMPDKDSMKSAEVPEMGITVCERTNRDRALMLKFDTLRRSPQAHTRMICLILQAELFSKKSFQRKKQEK